VRRDVSSPSHPRGSRRLGPSATTVTTSRTQKRNNGVTCQRWCRPNVEVLPRARDWFFFAYGVSLALVASLVLGEAGLGVRALSHRCNAGLSRAPEVPHFRSATAVFGSAGLPPSLKLGRTAEALAETGQSRAWGFCILRPPAWSGRSRTPLIGSAPPGVSTFGLVPQRQIPVAQDFSPAPGAWRWCQLPSSRAAVLAGFLIKEALKYRRQPQRSKFSWIPIASPRRRTKVPRYRNGRSQRRARLLGVM
jgi:hypothetical protein